MQIGGGDQLAQRLVKEAGRSLMAGAPACW